MSGITRISSAWTRYRLEGEAIGEVISVQNFGAGDLLEIRPADARQSVLVPFTKAAVPLVDVKNGRLLVDLPEDEDDQH